MSTDLRLELQEFQEFLSAKLTAGDQIISPEEALDQWRAIHPNEEAFAEDVAAVREALDDLAAGDEGVSPNEFDRQFRQRHGL
jgi:ubiquinone biosynthesis protein UbiJ